MRLEISERTDSRLCSAAALLIALLLAAGAAAGPATGLDHPFPPLRGEAPTLDSSYLMRGDAYDYTFPEAGRFEYLCVPHMDQAPMREATVTMVE